MQKKKFWCPRINWKQPRETPATKITGDGEQRELAYLAWILKTEFSVKSDLHFLNNGPS